MNSLSAERKLSPTTESSEQLYRAIIEQSPDSFVLLEPDTMKVIECNDAFRRLLGYDHISDLLHLTAYDFMALAPTTLKEMANMLLVRKEPLQGETPFRRWDQSLVPVNLSLSLVSHQQKSVFCLMAKDDSSRKQAMSDLNRLAWVAEKTSNGVIIWDTEGRIEWVNDGFTTLTGYPLAEIIGKKPWQFLHGEKTDPVAAQVIQTALGNCQPIEGELYAYHKSGRGYWAFFSITPIYDETGKHQGFISIEYDVTEQKELLLSLQQSREHYRALTEAAPDIILTISPQNEILFINMAVHKLLGYEPTEVMGLPLSLLLPESDSFKQLFGVQGSRVTKTEPISGGCVEIEARHADGQIIPMELCFSAFQLNRETYFSGVLRDITERKQAMDMLKQRELQAGIKAEVSATLSTPQVSLQCLLENTAKVLIDLLNLALVRIWTLNVETNTLELQANMGLPEAPLDEFYRIPVGEHCIGQVAKLRQRYMTNNAIKDVFFEHKEWAESENLTAFAAYPLMIEDRLVGAIALFSRHRFPPNIFGLFDTVTELVAQRIEIQWLDDALAEAYAKMEIRVEERTTELRQANHFLQNEINERHRIEQELQEAQGFLRQVLSDLPTAIFVKDENGRFTLVNEAFAAFYGLHPDDMIGKTDFDFSSPHEAELFRADDLLVMKSRQLKLIPEEKHTDNQGRVHWFHTAKRPFSLGPDQPQYLLGIATDLSEQKALENQLRQSQKLESIGQLAAGIAHEINTPTQYVGDNTRFVLDAYTDLDTIINKFRELLDSIRNGDTSPEVVAQIERDLRVDVMPLLEEIPIALQQSLEGVDRIAEIVRSMKEFSHPGSIEKRTADLNKAIESTITVARNEWKYVADLETNFDETLPAVPCLLGEFNQVILNLIVNAAHAIGDVVGDGSNGKGKITITTKQIGQQWAEIRISDTGGGIPESIQNLIFDPFFTTKEVGIGTGQGLAISHLVIVEKHQGQISFETQQGRGTTFIIRLPLEMNQPERG